MTNEELAKKRHTLAHLLAASVREIYPGAKNAIGPAVDDGFYQDFDLPETISSGDFKKIENKMRELLKKWGTFEKREVTKEEALQEFSWNEYKSELIEEFAGGNKTLTFYTNGGFVDLCKGGHAEDAKTIDPKSFKLVRVAGAYWRGDSTKPMLTRIYGLAFNNEEELQAHMTMLEEAKKRDHKKLGPALDLFTFSDLVGPGLPLWTPKGTLIRELVNHYVWELRKTKGYTKVEIPHITKKDLYETSGHWDKFKDELFRIKTREGHEFAMKPMNCPHHTQIYARRPHSYRELPVRYANTTMVYRDEQSGELQGLSRVRSITQDDAHVFCRTSQVKEEMSNVWEIIETFYNSFGFKLNIRLSFHDPEHPENYLGSPDVWKFAENQLQELVKEKGAVAEIALGEAAFYGPKIDFLAKDSIGREWQVATLQLDMNMPERFNLNCNNEEGQEERVVMIHAAIMGAIERFLSIIIEHFSGNFPLWLSPVQISILPISDKHIDYANKVKEELEKNIADIRIELDDRSESIGKKIRESTVNKVPYQIILGDKEKDSEAASLRKRSGEDQGSMSIQELVSKIKSEIENKSL